MDLDPPPTAQRRPREPRPNRLHERRSRHCYGDHRRGASERKPCDSRFTCVEPTVPGAGALRVDAESTAVIEHRECVIERTLPATRVVAIDRDMTHRREEPPGNPAFDATAREVFLLCQEHHLTRGDDGDEYGVEERQVIAGKDDGPARRDVLATCHPWPDEQPHEQGDSELENAVGHASIVPMAQAALIIVRFVLLGAGTWGLARTFTNGDPLHELVFFTTQSNLILAVVTLVALVTALVPALQRRTTVDGRPWWDTPGGVVARGAATLWICITGLVYHTLLSGPFAMAGSDVEPWALTSILMHTVTPVLAFVDWVLTGQSARTLRWRWSAWWLGYPLAYLAFALIRGLFVSEYPYPFVDVAELGYGGVTVMSIGLCLVFWLLGLAVIGLGRLGARLRGVGALSDQLQTS